MAKCDVCGNDYDKSFTVTIAGKMHVFDSFECAIHALAPGCQHCGCKVIGHGVEKDGAIYCCVHCAVLHGVHGLTDRVGLTDQVAKPNLVFPHDPHLPHSQPAMVPP
jgi:hypothetical protein